MIGARELRRDGGRVLVAVLAVVLSTASLAACTSQAGSGDAVSGFEALSAFGAPGRDVAYGPPATWLVPAADAAGKLVGLRETPVVEGPGLEPFDRDLPAQTLWAEPGSTGPHQGRSLLVGRTGVNEHAGTFEPAATVARRRLPDGRDATIGRSGPLDLVVVPSTRTFDCACAQELVVAGHGLSRSSLLDVAAHVDESGSRPAVVAGHLPGGLAPLGSLPLLGLDARLRNDGVALPAEQLAVLGPDWGVEADVQAGDARLWWHQRFWLEGERRLDLGSYHAFARLDVLGRQATDVVLALSYAAFAPQGAEPTGDQARPRPLPELVRAGHRRVEELQDEIVHGASTRADACLDAVPQTAPVRFDGVVDGTVRWAAEVGFPVPSVAGIVIAYCASAQRSPWPLSAAYPQRGTADSGDLGAPADLHLVGVLTTALRDERARIVADVTVVLGVVPAGARDVTVSVPNPGRGPDLAATAQVSDRGPGDGRHWFVATAYGLPDLSPPSVAATARAVLDDGTVLTATTADTQG